MCRDDFLKAHSFIGEESGERELVDQENAVNNASFHNQALEYIQFVSLKQY